LPDSAFIPSFQDVYLAPFLVLSNQILKNLAHS